MTFNRNAYSYLLDRNVDKQWEYCYIIKRRINCYMCDLDNVCLDNRYIVQVLSSRDKLSIISWLDLIFMLVFAFT